VKATGIVRRIDALGRIVLPKELRTSMNIHSGDFLEMFVKENDIIFRKHKMTCIGCGSQNDLEEFDEQLICRKCAGKINKLFTN